MKKPVAYNYVKAEKQIAELRAENERLRLECKGLHEVNKNLQNQIIKSRIATAEE